MSLYGLGPLLVSFCLNLSMDFMLYSNFYIIVLSFQIVDQKLFHDWPAKTGQQLICPAVASASEAQYSVITDEKVECIWF